MAIETEKDAAGTASAAGGASPSSAPAGDLVAARAAHGDPVATRAELPWINALRVVSTLAVVITHVSAGVVMTETATMSFRWWVANFTCAFFRWGVPVFVLVSGALLLDPSRQEGARRFYKKRIRRILLPLLFWSSVYALKCAMNDDILSRGFLNQVLRGAIYYHLWFIYMIPALYLFTPFLRTYIRSSSRPEQWHLVVVLFCLSGLYTTAEKVVGNRASTMFVLFAPFLSYFVCGYLLTSTPIATIGRRWLWLALVTGWWIIAVGTGINFNVLHGRDFLYRSTLPPTVLTSIAVFLLVRSIPFNRTPALAWTRALVHRIAPTSLGVYLLHPLILELLCMYIPLRSMNPLLWIPAISIATFASSCVAVSLIQRVPYLRSVV